MTPVLRQTPERAAVLTLVLCWILLFAVHMVGITWSPDSSWTAAVWTLALWTLMSMAMMLPSALSTARYVALNSLAWRRHRAVVTFVVSFALVWTAAGAVVLLALQLVAARQVALGGAAWVAPAFTVAAAWQIAPVRRRLVRCRASVPIRQRGLSAVRSCMVLGMKSGGRCVGSCWALMLAMALTSQHHLLWTVGLTAAVVGERRLARVRRFPQVLAAAFLVTAAAMVGVAEGTAAPTARSTGPTWLCPLPLAGLQ